MVLLPFIIVPPPAAASDLSEAIHALSIGDLERALVLAERGGVESDDDVVAAAVQAEAYRRSGRPGPSIMALRKLTRGSHGAWATLRIADIYRSVDREENAAARGQ
jgi:hypothetical protein